MAGAYGVLRGRYAGRVTFYIEADGTIRYIDRKVSPSTAGSDVAARLAELGFPAAAKPGP